MSTWENDIVAAFENLGGTASYSDLYDEISRIRPDLPQTWESIVRRRIQDLSSDSAGFKGGNDLFFSVEGLGNGVWGLRTHLRETPQAIDLPEGAEEPEKKYISAHRVVRDTVLTRKLKTLHRHRCQICGNRLELGDGEYYSEAHHIVPLGRDHNGSDVPGNIIVLCPNHHALCDFSAMTLSLEMLRTVSEHQVSAESVQYHNDVIMKDKV